jgi:proteasome beta subunit
MSNPIVEKALRYHGTTTVGIACTDGVVLATDTRAMAGGYFIAHRNVRKIYRIDQHLAMTVAGGVADAQNVVDILKYYAGMYRLDHGLAIPIRSAARLTANVFFSARLFPFIADVLVAGVDGEGSSVYNVDLFGSLNQERFVSTGSGSPVAYGILESEVKDGVAVSKAIPFAVKAVSAAMKRNAGTGDSFDVATVTKDGYRELSAEEKERTLATITGRG